MSPSTPGPGRGDFAAPAAAQAASSSAMTPWLAPATPASTGACGAGFRPDAGGAR